MIPSAPASAKSALSEIDNKDINVETLSMHLHQFDIRCLNAPTVLPRVALMFTRRGLPIEQLKLATSEDSQFQHMSITARCAQTLPPNSKRNFDGLWKLSTCLRLRPPRSQTPKRPNGVTDSRSSADLMSRLGSSGQFVIVWQSQIEPT